MEGSRTSRLDRTERPTALLSAVATLLGALFICLGQADPGPHHPTATAERGAAAAPVTAYTCPYDDGACGLLPVLSPAVLTAPPLDAPLEAGVEPRYPGEPQAAGRPDRSQAPARAPDLHVLQVLRT
ncbi:hypothetical protein OHS70_26860 [Streptomyces sp. NBC_00390]|uniref:hypothetical protein n=1 Tax=Streptomyces sp. NBC_00390 TaxID=2975736 RepID=UPI002E1DDC4A